MKLSMGKKWVVRRQEGFTLVGLAGLVVSSGIALGVAVQGIDIVSDIKKDQFYQDLRTMEDRVWAHQSLLGYWPGDCDKNGLIEKQPQQRGGADKGEVAKSCLSGGEEATMTALADIKFAGIVDEELSIQTMQQHSQQGVFEIGYGAVEDKNRNVIVAHDVPIEIAVWVDEAVDGGADGQEGRVRRWDESQGGSEWTGEAEQKVSLAYYFERKI